MITTSPTVLLIDGNEDSRELYTHLLRHYGYRVLRERDGRGRHRPDLVIIADEDEQGRDGCDRAIEWIHGASTDQRPVLLLTSYPEGPRWERICASERAVVLVIPVLPSTLVAHVRELLGERDGAFVGTTVSPYRLAV
jgi:response regulator RpfG family c-di-GMP phosphodiesterase